jgi:integrase
MTSPTLPPGDVVPLFQLLVRWQRFLVVSGTCGASTCRQYRNVVFDFCARLTADPEWTGGRDPIRATTDDVAAYLAAVTTQGGYRNQAIKGLKSWFGFLYDHDVIDREPLKAIKPRRRRRVGRPPNLTDEELERVFAAAERIDPRARPTMELAFETGARIGSLAAARAEDLHLDDPAGPWILWRTAKNDDPYESPLSERAEKACLLLLDLADWKPRTVGARRPTLIGVGEGAIWRWVHLAGERSGVPTWPHLFRHAFAYRVTNDPRIPPLVAAGLMNHKDTSQLTVYAAGDRDLARLAVADLRTVRPQE